MKRFSKRIASIGVSLALAGAVVSVVPSRADAFCGFYVSGSGQQLVNKATRVALMREGNRMALSMSNDYDGPPESFAMVVPVPVVLQKENVKTLPMNIFEHLDELTSPRLVEYWEQDPCYIPPPMPVMEAMAAPSSAAMGAGPGGGVDRPAVRIEAQFTVGEYEVLILSADESTALETWLHENKYNIPAGAAEALAPYVRDQWKFFVAKIDITKVQKKANGGARLSPLRFHYDSSEFRLPVRLGLLNAPDSQDLLVYVLHKTQRFEVANYPNVFIPTNLDVTDETRGKFAAFYNTLFDHTLQRAGGRAVVTEYAWGVGSCDPCPGPPMASGEMATLGGDVLFASQNNNAQPDYYSSGTDYVVTRLHTRYNRAVLTEDLVFREASAIVGGREHVTNANGEVEQGALPSNSYEGNNFQARYVIRHQWAGEIKCASPRRGIWGGPPNGGPESGTQGAKDLAEAPREGIQLVSHVVKPEIIGLTKPETLATIALPTTTPPKPPFVPAPFAPPQAYTPTPVPIQPRSQTAPQEAPGGAGALPFVIAVGVIGASVGAGFLMGRKKRS